ncbi:MAG: CpsD/CapB family tyrosine-protein kinase [Halobacteria archaeon]|nr:CpsD/CapB family tyrosine-protein kinase [Halobacteria archaeon]
MKTSLAYNMDTNINIIEAAVSKHVHSKEQARTSLENRGCGHTPSSLESSSAYTSNSIPAINQSLHDPSVAYYEELKANFLALHAERPMETILFSGTVNGDGATSTATNFANALACVPELKVLLIDANLRNPSLHDRFSINHTSSLAKLLEESIPGRTPFRYEQGQINVLPTGGIYSDPSRIFASRKFTELLQAMQQTYNFIVLDGPPVFRSSETRLLASKVDANILVIRSGKTRKQIAYRAIQELEAAGGNVLGTILNRRKYYIPDWLYRWL